MLLALALSSTAIFGLQQLQGHHSPAAAAGGTASVSANVGTPAHSPGAHAEAGAGHAGAHGAAAARSHPAGTPADHQSASALAPRDASGAVDHTAMTLMSGQTDGPSTPTNRTVPEASAAPLQEASPLLHWLRDSVLAVPVVLAALVLGAALVRRVRPGQRWSSSSVLAGRSLVASAALALASPGHGLLFGEGVTSVSEVGRVFLLSLPFTTAALIGLAVLAAGGRALTRIDRRRLSRKTVVGTTVAGLLSAVVGLPAGAATAAPPTEDGGGTTTPTAPAFCPSDARKITYELSAFSISIPLNGWGDKLPNGLSYALNAKDARIGESKMTANPNLTQPIVVRANVGDCITVKLKNDLSDKRVGIHPDGLVQLDPKTSDGARVGRNADTTAAPGSTATYTWYADKQGEVPLSDVANVDANAAGGSTVQRGLYGAVVVHPTGSTWRNSTTGNDLLDPATGRAVESQVYADVVTPTGALRSYAMVLMDENEDVKDRNGRQPTFPLTGLADSTFGINYRSEPLRNRLRAVLEHRGTKTPENPTGTAKTIRLPNGKTYAPSDHFCDGYVPELGKVVDDPGAKCLGEESHLQSWVYGDEGKLTRTLRDGTVVVDSDNLIPKAYVGDRTQFHVVHPGAKETHPWHQHTQRWFKDPNNPDSPRNDVQSIGPGEGYRMELEGGAGGMQRTAGDSIFHCHLYPHFAQGMWGHLRIFDKVRDGSQKYADGTPITALRELPDRAGQTAVPTETQPGFPLFVKGDFAQRAYRAPLAVVKDDFAAIRRPGDAPRQPTALEAAGLPALDPAKPGNGYIDPCPTGAPTRTYRPHVLDTPITYNSAGWKDRQGRLYAEESDVAAVRAGTQKPEPYTIRAKLGDCVQVLTTNDLHLDEDPNVPLDHVNRLDGEFMHAEETSEVSTHVHLVKFDELASDGTSVGWNYSSSAMPGQTYGYRWFVDQPLRTSFFHDHQYANLHQQKGLFAAMHVEPADATWHDPKTGAQTNGVGTVADIRSPSGPDFREISVFHQDRIPMWKNNGAGAAVNPAAEPDDYGADQGGYACWRATPSAAT